MSASKIIHYGKRQIKPVLSKSDKEVKTASIHLYKAFYRYIPHAVKDYYLPVTAEHGRARLRELFLENRHIKDMRVLDRLNAKAQMEFVEIASLFQQRHHVMRYFDDGIIPKKPEGFLEKFYAGEDL